MLFISLSLVQAYSDETPCDMIEKDFVREHNFR